MIDSPTPPPDDLRRYPMPFVRLEVVILALVEGALNVLLIKRKEAPYVGRWALPGGVLRIDVDATLEAAAQRVAKERLGIDLPYLRQQCAVGGAARDPRAPWALSIVHRALVQSESIAPEPGKRVDALRWMPVDALPDERQLAFDHGMLITEAVATIRAEVNRLQLPVGLLDDEFTLGELQSACESLLGRSLDKSSFRRRLNDAGCVDEVPGVMRTGAFRPAKLYRYANSDDPVA